MVPVDPTRMQHAAGFWGISVPEKANSTRDAFREKARNSCGPLKKMSCPVDATEDGSWIHEPFNDDDINDDEVLSPPPATNVSGDRPSRPSSASRRNASPFSSTAPAVVSVVDREDIRTQQGTRGHSSSNQTDAFDSGRVLSTQQSTTPRRYTLEELRDRPRSNPRTRTPMRYSSPIAPILNRTTVHDDDEDNLDVATDAGGRGAEGTGRVTIRAGAGSAIGTIRGGWGQRSDLPSTPERRRPSHQRSSRQGPSQRKIRRWNNDRFVGVAAELARSSAKGPAAAEAFLRGEADAPMYLIPNHPCKYRSEFARLTENNDGKYTVVKDRFIRGEIAAPQSPHMQLKATHEQETMRLDGSLMFQKIEPRLRDVLQRACSTKRVTMKLVESFETFLLSTHHVTSKEQVFSSPDLNCDEDFSGIDDILTTILLRSPVTGTWGSKSSEGSVVPKTRFYFPESNGFHRLLLHAVCQFHGLKVSSSTTPLDHVVARLLTVTGVAVGADWRLLDLVTERHKEKNSLPHPDARSGDAVTDRKVRISPWGLADVAESMSALQVS